MSGSVDAGGPSGVPQLFHYFLATGQAFFLRDGADSVEVFTCNTLTITTDRRIRAADIGKVQQAIQMATHKAMAEQVAVPVKIVNVVILGIAFLGVFSQGEFEAGSMLENLRVDQQQLQ